MEDFLQSLKRALPSGIRAIRPSAPMAIIESSDPMEFWSLFIGATQENAGIAILDPSWPEAWRQEFRELARDRLAGSGRGEILIPTSGTSGKPHFCIHSLNTIRASADSFGELFQAGGPQHAVIVLPPCHVGGMMPVLRSAACGGRVRFSDYRNLRSVGLPDPGNTSISLVPTQLSRLAELPDGRDFLKKFAMILVGGAHCPNPLLQRCRQQGLHLAPCYGSTETAAMVAVLQPQAFLDGQSGVGKPMPGVRILADDDHRILVDSDSCFLGYLPADRPFTRSPFATSDIGQFDPSGNLHILGRADRVINTGGKKVIPEQVESASWESGLIVDVVCKGEPDSDWGQRVCLDVVFSDAPDAHPATLKAYLRQHLPGYAVPKDIRALERLDRTALGKVNNRI